MAANPDHCGRRRLRGRRGLVRAIGIWSNIIDFVSLLYSDLAQTYETIDCD
jgi:hypothetical protein